MSEEMTQVRERLARLETLAWVNTGGVVLALTIAGVPKLASFFAGL